ncbi:MAG: hypothetical protein IJ105_04880 [Bacilli bacterium]|nr:hypothetical protein [Bacilli bacterium]
MKINPKKVFNSIMFALFTLFVSLYIASNNGYYEYQNKEKTTLTNEKMKQFEEDIKNGKRVDIKNYLSTSKKNYNNKITKLGNTLSDVIDYSMMEGLEKTFNFFEKMIE